MRDEDQVDVAGGVVLTRTLGGLEEAGFVRHIASGPAPARVEYPLTERCHSLREQLRALGRWVGEGAI